MRNRPDDFVTATIGEKEYVIEKIKRVENNAKIDDSVTHLKLELRECEVNIIR